MQWFSDCLADLSHFAPLIVAATGVISAFVIVYSFLKSHRLEHREGPRLRMARSPEKRVDLFVNLHGVGTGRKSQDDAADESDRKSTKPGDILAAITAYAGLESAREQQGCAALQVYAGKLVERIPRFMRVGRREQIEVRIGAEGTPKLAMGLVGSGAITEHGVPVVETMSLDLYSPDDSFKIEPVSDREQLVKKDVLKDTLLGAALDDYGRWLWFVTPLRRGEATLALRVSARVLDSQGHPTPHTLVPDRTIEVSVRVNPKRVAASFGKWAGVTIPIAAAVAIFGAGVEEQVWPVVKAFLAWLLGT